MENTQQQPAKMNFSVENNIVRISVTTQNDNYEGAIKQENHEDTIKIVKLLTAIANNGYSNYTVSIDNKGVILSIKYNENNDEKTMNIIVPKIEKQVINNNNIDERIKSVTVGSNVNNNSTNESSNSITNNAGNGVTNNANNGVTNNASSSATNNINNSVTIGNDSSANNNSNEMIKIIDALKIKVSRLESEYILHKVRTNEKISKLEKEIESIRKN